MMRPFYFFSAAVLGVVFSAEFACSPGTDCDFGQCASAVGDGGGADSDGTAPIPPGCDPAADAQQAPACIDDSFAVFVDASGDDGNDGKKATPVKTIGTALKKLAGKPRIYLCGVGPYAESVKLTAAVNLHGGFTCGSWAPGAPKAKIAPTAPGYALHVEGVASEITISDVELASADATEAGGSSIAVLADRSTVRFLRAGIAAGSGKDGAPGGPGERGLGKLHSVSAGDKVLKGNAATGTTAGIAKVCTCSNSTQTTKGGGGGSPEGTGVRGDPAFDGGAPEAGAGGTGQVLCESGGFGKAGWNAPAGAPALPGTTIGKLEGTTWLPGKGTDGTGAVPGQGGGGGGGADLTAAGGGGGCGGCGGDGGKAGEGGGASIALLALESTIAFSGSSFSTGVGGRGGPGGPGGEGEPGGGGGVGDCQGGSGGKGGTGGGGSGGAGGLSVGILYKSAKGEAPTVDTATQDAITLGTPGQGGDNGQTSANKGPNGIAEKLKDASQL